MNLIGILIALGLERLLGQLPGWGRPLLFLGYVRALMALLPFPPLWRSPVALLLLLLPPLLLIWVLSGVFTHPLADLAWSSLVLLLCLGPRDLAEDGHRRQKGKEK